MSTRKSTRKTKTRNEPAAGALRRAAPQMLASADSKALSKRYPARVTAWAEDLDAAKRMAKALRMPARYVVREAVARLYDMRVLRTALAGHLDTTPERASAVRQDSMVQPKGAAATAQTVLTPDTAYKLGELGAVMGWEPRKALRIALQKHEAWLRYLRNPGGTHCDEAVMPDLLVLPLMGYNNAPL